MVRKYENPRSKVRARQDCNSIEVTIPEAIAIGYGLKHGFSIIIDKQQGMVKDSALPSTCWLKN